MRQSFSVRGDLPSIIAYWPDERLQSGGIMPFLSCAQSAKSDWISSKRKAAGASNARWIVRRRVKDFGIAACQFIVAMLLASIFLAESYGITVAPSSTSGEAKQEAINVIPFDKMTEEAQGRLWDVLSAPSIYRRMPTETINCEPEMHVLMVRHPEVIVNIWAVMGVTEVNLDRTGDFSFRCSDGAGSVSDIELIYGTNELHVYFVTTHYDGPMFARPVDARTVLVLRSKYGKNSDGLPVATSTMDAFIRIDQATAKLVIRTLAPVVGKTADHNFTEGLRFVGRVWETAAANGPGMERLANKLEKTSPEVRAELARVSHLAAHRAAERELAQAGIPTMTSRTNPVSAEASNPAVRAAQPSAPRETTPASATTTLMQPARDESTPPESWEAQLRQRRNAQFRR